MVIEEDCKSEDAVLVVTETAQILLQRFSNLQGNSSLKRIRFDLEIITSSIGVGETDVIGMLLIQHLDVGIEVQASYFRNDCNN